MDDDAVFKALADDGRRTLLDELFRRDGQTLTELQTYLDMSRFGVMKHLQVLEDAGLITTQKVGREKHHYLNPVPIQLVYNRWVSKYAQPWTQGLAALKDALEEPMNAAPAHVFQTFIRTTPERLWQALTDGNLTPQYYFGSRVESSWQPGAAYRYLTPDDNVLLHGEVVESVPPTRLVTTFLPLYAGPNATTTRVEFDIEQQGPVCKLTLTHHDLSANDPAASGIIEGWARILSGLKTLLETGEPLPTA